MVDTLLQNGLLSDEAGPSGRDNTFGFGVANALKSVHAAQSLASGDSQLDAPASVVASPAILSLGALSADQISISNQGGGSPSVSSIEASDAWITVAPADTDVSGFGVYDLTIDRNTLGDGLYLGSITFNFDSANTISVSVAMTIGAVESEGQPAPIYALVVNSTTNEVVKEVLAIDNGDGTASYSAQNIPAGFYVVIAGSDIDNDLVICQVGEACGAYPSLGAPFDVEVNGSDISELNFNADIVSGFDSLGGGVNTLQRVLRPGPVILRSNRKKYANTR